LSFAAVLAGCPPRGGDGSDAGVAGGSGGSDAGWRLSRSSLDSWLKYQGEVGAAFEPVSARDGGPTLHDELRRRAKAERAARLDAGLSLEEIDRIDELAGAVVAARTVARLAGGDAALKLEKAASGVKGQSKEQADEALADLLARADGGERYAEQRERFGDGNVELVLSRLDDVERAWSAALEPARPDAGR
jgi:hypothetical protein